jgi:hypothetical protein
LRISTRQATNAFISFLRYTQVYAQWRSGAGGSRRNPRCRGACDRVTKSSANRTKVHGPAMRAFTSLSNH